MKPISKSDVEKYILGLISDPARKSQIEEARERDPFVRKWFRLWSTDQADLDANFRHLGAQLEKAVAATPALPDVFDKDSRVSEITARLANYNATRYGGRSFDLQANYYVGASTGESTEAKSMPKSRPHIENGKLVCELERHEVSYAVARVVARRGNEFLASRIVVLDYLPGSKRWRLSLPLLQLFGEVVPKDEIRYDVQPANEESLKWFPADAVRDARKFAAPGILERDAAVDELLKLLDA